MLKKSHEVLLVLFANTQEKIKSFQSIAWPFWCMQVVKTRIKLGSEFEGWVSWFA